MSVTDILFKVMRETAEEKGSKLQPSLTMSISELGFDSMDWAVIVVKLEQELGFDPFAEGARFDLKNVQDFLNLYENHA